jgi:endonuclease YncB( thermonuclease family)
MREFVLRFAARQVGALAFAGLLAFPLFATQGREAAVARANAPPPSGSSIEGPARVVDGDTIVIGETRIRLEGIDAPEAGQTCAKRWAGTWPCGEDATTHLARLVRDRQVRCDSRGTDAYGRMLGICFTEGLDLNADMVRNGFAWAFVKYSARYVEAEAEARALNAGIWQGKSTPAWVWRAERWSKAAAEPPVEGGADTPKDCVIKGNITRSGQIYHMPWSPWYHRTRVEPQRGERWFCTEAEAMAAGWRPAYTR